MTTTTAATRRSFIAIAGAALSAPVAAAAATSSMWRPPSGGSGATLAARLAKLEDLDAIRALNQRYAVHVNAGAHEVVPALFADPSAGAIDPCVRAIAPEGFGEHDVIDIATDGQTATALLHGTVHTETPLESCPLADMAREQGGGVVSRVESGVFENAYVKRGGVWKFERSTHRPA